MSVRTKVATVLLTATFVCPLLVSAGPRKATPPPPLLSPQEQSCEALGKFTLDVGVDRNRGVSLFASLRHSRAQGSPPHFSALYDDIITLVYTWQSVSPLGLQQIIESMCLKEVSSPATTAREVEGSRERY